MPRAKIISPAFWASSPAAMPIAGTPDRASTVGRGTSHPFYPVVKPTLDVITAVVLILLLSPLLTIIAVAIKLTTPGAFIFRQVRVGKDMRLFTCYKFRSMVSNAEWILEEDQELRAIYAVNWKMTADPRITAFGRFLRKTSLDELPQLVNVIRGDMSLVGPRPYMPRELGDEFGLHADLITQVRPGMTGLWQVSGRSTLTPRQRLDLDKQYVCDVNAARDARILLKTVKVVTTSFGAC